MSKFKPADGDQNQEPPPIGRGAPGPSQSRSSRDADGVAPRPHADRIAIPAGDGHWQTSVPRVSPGTGWGLGFPASVVSAVARRVAGTRTANLFTTLGRDWRLFGPWLVFAAQLMPFGALPRSDSELVILRVAWNCRCRYEWEHHVRLGGRAGLDDQTIARVQDGPDAEGWTVRQAALLAAVDELHDDRTIRDTTWAVLAAHLDERSLIELCMLVGHYEMLAMAINALGIEIDQPNSA